MLEFVVEKTSASYFRKVVMYIYWKVVITKTNNMKYGHLKEIYKHP